MKVLLTGGSGYIGRAIVEALRAAGHEALAVARSGEAADAARRLGAEAVPGDLRDPEGLAAAADAADAVIHAANTNSPDAAEIDTAATRAFLRALAGTGKPFVYTSGVWVLGATRDRVADEGAPPNPTPLIAWRGVLERQIGAAHETHGVVLRPGVVFGKNGGIPASVARGDIPVVADGAQRWPLVHVRDLADLYVRALDAPRGAVLHGVSTSATMREIALLGAALQRRPAPAALPLDVARGRFGAFADALALDQNVSSSRTRTLVGWTPGRRSIIEELVGSIAAPEGAAA
ncbi:MAG TPA: NAD-dependent epimerase/dehydratase family protein [Gemmatimonadaceae bacterium]